MTGLLFAQTIPYFLLLAAGSGIAVGGALVYLLFRLVYGRTEEELEAEKARVLEKAEAEAEALVTSARLEMKEELIAKRSQLDDEVEERLAEAKALEKRLEKREDNLQERERAVTRREDELGRRGDEIRDRESELETLREELEGLKEEQMRKLREASGLDEEEATELLLERLSTEVEHEQAAVISRILERTKEDAEKQARKILSTAIQRVAADHTQEVTTSTVDLPNDDMKGRIIGREGRNIRAFEKATGVDVIVDDTPGIVVISSFDAVRREIARRALEKLVLDGRIHPARIEEMVAETKEQIEARIQEIGKEACLDVDLPGLHPRLIELLGRLHFRTSYGQNVLAHSIEVSNLCGTIAGELDLDIPLAKRCGFLHDIGKAVDHEKEGGHPEIGADLCRRYDEPPEVVNACASHHDGVPQKFVYSFVVMAADAASGSRPGARRETLGRYINRMERLEDIARGFDGVNKVYAIQAGREVRVIVDSADVSDKKAPKLARDIAKKIENKMTYPGEVKVTLLRETRVVEYAR